MNFRRITVAVGAVAMTVLLTGCGALRAPSPSPPPPPEIPEVPAPPAEPASPATVVEALESTVESLADDGDGATVKPAPTVTVESIKVAPAGDTAAVDASTEDDGVTVAEIPAPPADLWQRLRAQFRLDDATVDARRLRYYEAWYAARPAYFARLTERAQWFLPYILDAVEARGMPGEIALLPAIESAFRPDAVSRSRAVGLWQFIAATGRRYGLRQDWWLDERRDLPQSTRAALDYLDFLQQEFDGDWELALAAYNAGEGAVRRAVKRNRASGRPAHYAALKLRRETADYVPKLLAVRNIIAAPENFGIELNPLPNRAAVTVVDARTQTDLSVAAEAAGVSLRQLRYLNQGYRRGATPPNGPHILVAPVEYAAAMADGLNRLGADERLRWARHRVRAGENLSVIAHKYGVPVRALLAANSLTSSLIHPKQALRIPLSAGYQFAGAPPAGNDAAGKTHTVQRGDSLWRIARRYGISVAELTRWNRIARDALLHPGQELVVGR